MREQPKAVGAKGNPRRRGAPIVGYEKLTQITLDEVGIDKNLAHRARKLARMTPEEFEALFY